MHMLCEVEILSLLSRIDSGEVPLVVCFGPEYWHDGADGLITHQTPNGLQIDVYVDAGSWDYIYGMRDPDGTPYPESMFAFGAPIGDWSPENYEAWDNAPRLQE